MKISLYEILINLLLKKKTCAKKVSHLPIEEINTIAVFSNTAIGDTLFNTPVFRALKETFPAKKLVVILNPTNFVLFQNNPHIDDIILYDGKWKNFFKILKQLKDKQIDLSLILHSNEPQATPLAVLANSKYVIKIPNDKTKHHVYHNNEKMPPYENKHGIYDRLRTLEFLNIFNPNPKMELFINQSNHNEIKQFFFTQSLNPKEDILIGFQIGASTKSRMWFENKWIELGKKLLNFSPKIKIILTGSPSERDLTSKVFTALQSKRVYNAAGKFSLQSAAALIGTFNVLVTPDTGPMHIATALSVPTVGLFAVADPIKSNACYDENIHLYIKKPKTCFPCIAKRCKYQKCMEQIEVNEVYEYIIRLLNA